MKFKRFINFLIKSKIEFSTEWDTDGYYYVTIILGNRELIIREDDTDMIESIWNEILEYWI